MGLVESGLITKTLVLVAPGLVLVVSGYEPPGLCFSPWRRSLEAASNSGSLGGATWRIHRPNISWSSTCTRSCHEAVFNVGEGQNVSLTRNRRAELPIHLFQHDEVLARRSSSVVINKFLYFNSFDLTLLYASLDFFFWLAGSSLILKGIEVYRWGEDPINEGPRSTDGGPGLPLRERDLPRARAFLRGP